VTLALASKINYLPAIPRLYRQAATDLGRHRAFSFPGDIRWIFPAKKVKKPVCTRDNLAKVCIVALIISQSQVLSDLIRENQILSNFN
jgi:hypothetical protein